MFIRLIFALIVIYLIYRLAKRFFLPSAKQRDKFPERPTAIGGEDLVEDPYCHTYVPISDAYKASLNGETVYFCSKECFEKYKAEKKNN